MSLLDETVLKSDEGLQVERTTLSWLRTLFVSALITLSIAKVLYGAISWLLLFSLIGASLTCFLVYNAGANVANKRVNWKGKKYRAIMSFLSLSALFYGWSIFNGLLFN